MSAGTSCGHPNYQKPELVAEAPNQVWSWDITKLRGPVKWTYFYLYVILDIFSRLRDRVDVGSARKRRARPSSHQRELPQAEHRSRFFTRLLTRTRPLGLES